MENFELQKIWRSVDMEISRKSKEELMLLLSSKAKQTLNKFLLIMGLSIVISIGFLIFLAITSIKRKDDVIYIINNATLGIITLVSLIIGLSSWYKLQNDRFDKPLNEWLNFRIRLLNKWLKGRYNKLYVVLLPLLYVLTVLSIHVYYEYKPFMEVLKTEESLTGLLIGLPVGLFVAFYVYLKIRRYQLKNLQFLEDMEGGMERD